MKLVTIDRLGLYMSMSPTEIENTTELLGLVLDTVSELFEKVSRRKFDYGANVVDLFKGGPGKQGRRVCWLQTVPVSSIVNIWVDDDGEFGDARLLKAADWYLSESGNGVWLKDWVYIPHWNPNPVIKIEYEGGYLENLDEPGVLEGVENGLQLLALEQGSFMMQKYGRAGSMSADGDSSDLSDLINKDILIPQVRLGLQLYSVPRN